MRQRRNLADAAAQSAPITEAELNAAMSMADAPEPDLFIRTGGEKRISNFLLWQMAYTEMVFTDTLWPDAEGDAARNALDNALHRLRKWLGGDDRVLLRQGALALNSARCWTDVAALEVLLDDELELDDYVVNFRRMYGNPRMDAVLGSVDGSVRFFGLTPTSMKLEGLDRHCRLTDSYKKMHMARGNVAAKA